MTASAVSRVDVPLVTPVVSVIVAAYNAEASIGAAIESVLSQTVSNLELVIVDDGSVDRTADIAFSFREADARVKVLRHRESRGPSAARNTAISAARGRWIAVLDSDDLFELDRLEILIEQADSRGLDLIADNLALVDASSLEALGEAFPTEWLAPSVIVDLEYLMTRDWPGRHDGRGIGFLKPIIKRELLGPQGVSYADDIRAGEDLLLLASLIQAGAKMGLHSQSLYKYSVRRGSLSRSLMATFSIVEVNQRIAMGASAEDRAKTDFQARKSWWLYQGFVSSLKSAQWQASLKFAREIPPSFFAQRLGRLFLKKVCR